MTEDEILRSSLTGTRRLQAVYEFFASIPERIAVLKLLVDENLPPRTAVDLADLFPESAHVDSVGLGSTSDSIIWEYTKRMDSRS